MPEAGTDDVDHAAETAARLRAAEDRLYPLALVDVERYQRGTALCGLVLEDLRATTTDIPSVMHRRAWLLDHLPGMADESGLGLLGLEPDTIVDAAAAQRCRELEREQARARHVARVAAARATGRQWLVDEPAPWEVMAGVYRRVEHHLPTGTQLVSRIEAGDPDRPTSYVLETVPDAGDGGQVRTETFTDEAAWRRALDQRRSEVSSRP